MTKSQPARQHSFASLSSNTVTDDFPGRVLRACVFPDCSVVYVKRLRIMREISLLVMGHS